MYHYYLDIENENIADSYIEYSQDTTLVKDGFGEKVNASNTINYVLLKKYGYDETVLEKYYSQGIIQGDLFHTILHKTRKIRIPKSID